MQIYLPIAEIAIQVQWVVMVGIFSGMMSGLFGIGGNFITIPTLIFMNVPPTVALSSAVNQTVASSFSSFLNHWRKSNVDIEIGMYLLFGGFLGAILGSVTFKFLKGAGYMDVVIFLIYIVILGTMGTTLAIESFQKIFFKKKKKARNKKLEKEEKRSFFLKLPLRKKFKISGAEISIVAIISLGIFIAFLVSISGVGGGFILVPALIYAFRVPTTVAIGTSVFQAVFVTMVVTFLHAITAKTVDVLLALMLVSGALLGVNIGIRISAKLKPEMLRGLLSVIVLFGFFRLVVALFMAPTDLYSFSVAK